MADEPTSNLGSSFFDVNSFLPHGPPPQALDPNAALPRTPETPPGLGMVFRTPEEVEAMTAPPPPPITPAEAIAGGILLGGLVLAMTQKGDPSYLDLDLVQRLFTRFMPGLSADQKALAREYAECEGEASSIGYDNAKARRDALWPMIERKERLWKNDEPTKAHWAMIRWAHSPTPKRLARWLRDLEDLDEARAVLRAVKQYVEKKGTRAARAIAAYLEARSDAERERAVSDFGEAMGEP